MRLLQVGILEMFKKINLLNFYYFYFYFYFNMKATGSESINHVLDQKQCGSFYFLFLFNFFIFICLFNIKY
jgi:hypothetical protein